MKKYAILLATAIPAPVDYKRWAKFESAAKSIIERKIGDKIAAAGGKDVIKSRALRAAKSIFSKIPVANIVTAALTIAGGTSIEEAAKDSVSYDLVNELADSAGSTLYDIASSASTYAISGQNKYDNPALINSELAEILGDPTINQADDPADQDE